MEGGGGVKGHLIWLTETPWLWLFLLVSSTRARTTISGMLLVAGSGTRLFRYGGNVGKVSSAAGFWVLIIFAFFFAGTEPFGRLGGVLEQNQNCEEAAEKKDKDRRKGKGRRCCLGDRID